MGIEVLLEISKYEYYDYIYGDKICSEYQHERCLLKDLSDKYKITTYLVTKIINGRGFELKNEHEVAKEVNFRGRFNQRKYDVNYDFFKVWTHNMAYILGFIYADGYLGKDNSGLRINLQLSDQIFLNQIREELGYEGEVKTSVVKTNNKIYNYCYLDISSMDIISDLRRLGVYPNKSLTVTYPDFIPKEFEIDFLRGIFDGDGCVEVKRQIHKTKNSDTYQLRSRFVSGSSDFINGIESVMRNSYGFKKKNISHTRNRTAMELAYSTHESEKLYKLFYENENVLYLPRKKEKFELGFKLRSEHIYKR